MKKITKPFLTIIAALLIVTLILTGCSDGNTTPTTESPATPTTPTTTPTNPATPVDPIDPTPVDPNPHTGHGSGPHINNNLIPGPTTESFSTERLQTTDEQASLSGDGVAAFRIPCGYSHMAYDDPIVFPNEPGRSHLHTFFGNTLTNANSTVNSIANTGNSTCRGGTINRSSYWVPSLINTTNGAPIMPESGMFYYKTGYRGVTSGEIQAMPNGLRMISGNASATTAPPQYSSPYRFHCVTSDSSSHHSNGFSIPDCAAGEFVGVELWFPQCWDGVNLDSADHKSHLTYAENGCPSSHPVALPEITFNISWRVPEGATGADLRLSSDSYAASVPGGYSMHGDWFMGWKEDVRNAWISDCINAGRDCHAHLLGDGRAMY